MKKCETNNCLNDATVKGLCRKCYDRKKYLESDPSKRNKNYIPVGTYRRGNRTPNDFIIEGDICKIGIYNSDNELIRYTLIDKEDAERCKQYKWRLLGNYIVGGPNSIPLHHFVLKSIPIRHKTVIDHKDTDTWNNTKYNLRYCTESENQCNRDKQANNKSGYKGVYWHKSNEKWVALIMKDGKKHYLGYFDHKIDAALAYDKAAKELHGEFAYCNIPDAPW